MTLGLHVPSTVLQIMHLKRTVTFLLTIYHPTGAVRSIVTYFCGWN